jgi:hypothetical protein
VPGNIIKLEVSVYRFYCLIRYREPMTFESALGGESFERSVAVERLERFERRLSV